jgi:hypothetical protein
MLLAKDCNKRLEHMVNTDTLEPGMVISYKLLPKDRPTDPDRLWRGKIQRVNISSVHRNLGHCWVESLEGEPYTGLTEVVTFAQIVGAAYSPGAE